MKKQLSHGVSNFAELIRGNSYYIDRTKYISLLETVNSPSVVFFRPRKFGKSLFVSTLHYYYGKEFKQYFEELFGNLAIGQSPTNSANSYYVLRFDFSGINTQETSATGESFKEAVLYGIKNFLVSYNLFGHINFEYCSQPKLAAEVIRRFFSEFRLSDPIGKVYILIDEYDHFTNELISFNISEFKNSVSRNGYVRKFYEAIKEAVGLGIVGRFFATGVTPVTLDSMTSGFNISLNLTTDSEFNEMLGFTDDDVKAMLEYYEIDKSDLILKDIRNFYNGSLFSKYASTRLYNSNMVLYFLSSLLRTKRYPDPLVDSNIMSDYGKINNLFALKNDEKTEKRIIELLTDGETVAELTTMFSFEIDLSTDDIISLLFYHGLLTIKGERLGSYSFKIPNYAIEQMYWRFQAARIQNQSKTVVDTDTLRIAIQQMATYGKIDLWIDLINKTLDGLSNRDLQNFSEKYIKMLFLAFSSLSPVFLVKSESETNRKYTDLFFLKNKSVETNYQLLFEFKYLKVGDEVRKEEVLTRATEQLSEYLRTPEIALIQNLVAYIVITIGAKAYFYEVKI